MTQPIVFFDLGQTLGFESRDAAGRIVTFDVYADIPALLGRVGQRARLGVLTAGDRWSAPLVETLLADRDLLQFFDPALLRHAPVESPTHFATLVDSSAPDHVFVSANPTRRSTAQRAHMRACPHPALVEAMLDGQQLRIVSIAAGAGVALTALLAGRPGVVPLALVDVADGEAPLAFALAGDTGIAALQASGAIVVRLGNGELAASAEICMLKCGAWNPDQRDAVKGRLAAAGLLLYASDRHLVFADLPDHPAPTFDLPTCSHSSTVLQPRLALLQAPAAGAAAIADDHVWDVASLSADPQNLADLGQLTPTLYDQYLRPWWGGLGALPNGSRLDSRHYLHPDNRLAVKGAVQLLGDICGTDNVRLHTFDGPGGPPLDNVEAELLADPTSPTRDEIVVVAAHIDSINSEGQAHATQSAPGLNDDASGVAGVLAVADVLARIRARVPFKRRVRFLLFNAEEARMYGSQQYVADHKGKAAIIAMFQLDMIGYLRGYPPGPCEVHSGWAEDESIRLRSQGLATLIKDAAAVVSPSLQPVQVYPYGKFCKLDGTASDHASFYDFPSPACLLCEDMFIDGCGGGMHPNHPTYHSSRDVCVNTVYASDLARAAAAAIWVRANHT